MSFVQDKTRDIAAKFACKLFSVFRKGYMYTCRIYFLKSSAFFCRTCVMHYYITTFASQRINICEGQHFTHTQILS